MPLGPCRRPRPSPLALVYCTIFFYPPHFCSAAAIMPHHMFQLPGDPSPFFVTGRSIQTPPRNDDRYELIGGDTEALIHGNTKRFEVDQGGVFRGDTSDVNFYHFEGDSRSRGEKRSRLLIRPLANPPLVRPTQLRGGPSHHHFQPRDGLKLFRVGDSDREPKRLTRYDRNCFFSPMNCVLWRESSKDETLDRRGRTPKWPAKQEWETSQA